MQGFWGPLFYNLAFIYGRPMMLGFHLRGTENRATGQ